MLNCYLKVSQHNFPSIKEWFLSTHQLIGTLHTRCKDSWDKRTKMEFIYFKMLSISPAYNSAVFSHLNWNCWFCVSTSGDNLNTCSKMERFCRLDWQARMKGKHSSFQLAPQSDWCVCEQPCSLVWCICWRDVKQSVAKDSSVLFSPSLEQRDN